MVFCAVLCCVVSGSEARTTAASPASGQRPCQAGTRREEIRRIEVTSEPRAVGRRAADVERQAAGRKARKTDAASAATAVTIILIQRWD